MNLVHYSNIEGLTVLDPKVHGTGLLGAEAKRKRDYPELYLPRTYFGLPGYEKEQGLGKFKYKVSILTGLYDLDKDPMGLYPSPEYVEKNGYAPMDRNAAMCIFEKQIYFKGFEGYFSRSGKVAAKFTKTKV